MAPSKECVVCDKGNGNFCGRCKGAAYCSKECQKADWPVHKLLCADFADFDMSARPSPDHFLGLHLPEDDEKPQWTWMKTWVNGDGGVMTLDEDPVTHRVKEFGDDTVDVKVFPHDFLFNRDLRKNITVHFSSNFMYNGRKLNKGIQKILKTNPGQTYPFKGPFTALCCYNDLYDMAPIRRDMDMKDFRHLANCLISYKRVGTNGKMPVDLPSAIIMQL